MTKRRIRSKPYVRELPASYIAETPMSEATTPAAPTSAPTPRLQAYKSRLRHNALVVHCRTHGDSIFLRAAANIMTEIHDRPVAWPAGTTADDIERMTIDRIALAAAIHCPDNKALRDAWLCEFWVSNNTRDWKA